MPHFSKPYFKVSRAAWYAEFDRKQYSLGPNPPHRPKPVKKNDVWQAPKEILDAFEDLKARLRQSDQPQLSAPGQPVVVVFDEFLEWCQKHKSERTYVWYRKHIQSFIKHIHDGKPFRTLTVAELKPIHVERWVDAHPTWGTSHQRGGKTAVQGAFRWAERMGVVAQNPVRHLPKPPPGKREQIISTEEHAAILAHFPDRAFRDLLQMAWHTGARPQECVRVEARHVELDHRRIVLPPAEAKGKKRYRIIYLNDTALELVRELRATLLDGHLFRNTDGRPWNAWSVNSRFCRYQLHRGRQDLRREGFTLDPARVEEYAATLNPEKTVAGRPAPKGRAELLREARKKLMNTEARKRGEKFCLYAYRHTFANRLLTAGVDSLTVSTLLGHVDGTMLSRVYQHLQQNAAHLLDAVNTVKRPGAAA
ncbi:MAG: xerC 1 [Gemmataceae bacterium]|nr:xerC 1 [Gemmataceae bacterium]